MTDRTDGDCSDGPSDASSDSDSFEPAGNSDASSRAVGAERDSVARDSAVTDGDDGPEGIFGWIRWFRTSDREAVIYLRDILTSIVLVLVIGVLLFAVSGVWPPMVAVESGSMEPNMERGDLVFIADNERYVPDEAVRYGGVSTGVVPSDRAEPYDRMKFGSYGDVIVFRPNGNAGQVPIIHRAMFWVDEGEDWYDRADPTAIGSADDCEELNHCPAPHAGFITKGDNERTNANYDQASRLSAPVHPTWIVGTAELRVPYLGHVRLLFSGVTVRSLEPVEAVPGNTTSTDPTVRDVLDTDGPTSPVRATPLLA